MFQVYNKAVMVRYPFTVPVSLKGTTASTFLTYQGLTGRPNSFNLRHSLFHGLLTSLN